MASNITSAGSASGMDFESIIAATVSAKKAQLERQTKIPLEEQNIALSGISKLKSALEEFQKALDALSDKKGFNVRKVHIDQPEDNPYFTMTTKDDAANAIYDIAVEQLASSEQLTQHFDKNGEDKVMFAPGKITITLPPKEKAEGDTSGKDEGKPEDNTITIEIKEPVDLAGLRRLINEQAGDRGISASVLETSDGSMLTIDSGMSGKKHQGEFKIAYEADPNYKSEDEKYDAEKAKANGALLNYGGSKDLESDGKVGSWDVKTPKDAVIKVNGATITSDTNTFSNQISGVELVIKRTTLNEEKSKDGEKVYDTKTATVSQDNDAIAKKVQEFVGSYNKLVDTMASLSKRNTYSDGQNNYDGGELAGDSQLMALQRQLQTFMTNLHSTDGVSPYDLGISVDNEGKFKLDEAKFKEGLDDNFNAIVKMFSAPANDKGEGGGLIVQLDKIIDKYTESNGILDKRKEEADAKVKDLNAKIANNNAYLEKYEEALRKKYANLDTTIAGYNQSLSYIQSVLG